MLERPSEGGWELADIVEAVKASPSRDFIKRLLSWECAVCSWALPRNKVLPSCRVSPHLTNPPVLLQRISPPCGTFTALLICLLRVLFLLRGS